MWVGRKVWKFKREERHWHFRASRKVSSVRTLRATPLHKHVTPTMAVFSGDSSLGYFFFSNWESCAFQTTLLRGRVLARKFKSMGHNNWSARCKCSVQFAPGRKRDLIHGDAGSAPRTGQSTRRTRKLNLPGNKGRSHYAIPPPLVKHAWLLGNLAFLMNLESYFTRVLHYYGARAWIGNYDRVQRIRRHFFFCTEKQW